MPSLLQRQPTAESPLDRLEREANDDFLLLEEIGPTPFGTDHLLELREQIRQRLSFFDRRQRLAMLLGGTASGWVFLGFIAGRLGWFWPASAALVLAGASLAGFMAVLFSLKKRFESRGELEHTAREIETELHRRAASRKAK